MDIFIEYWGLILAALGGIAYFITHRQVALSFVKKSIYELMLAAEKRAEDLVLETGKAKKDWVIYHGYDKLPSFVRLVVSRDLFVKLVQELFDKAVSWAEKYKTEIML